MAEKMNHGRGEFECVQGTYPFSEIGCSETKVHISGDFIVVMMLTFCICYCYFNHQFLLAFVVVVVVVVVVVGTNKSKCVDVAIRLLASLTGLNLFVCLLYLFYKIMSAREKQRHLKEHALSYFSPPENDAESVQRCGIRVVPHPWVGLEEPQLFS